MDNNILFVDLLFKNEGHHKTELLKLRKSLEGHINCVDNISIDDNKFLKKITLGYLRIYILLILLLGRYRKHHLVLLSGKTSDYALFALLLKKRASILFHFLPAVNRKIHVNLMRLVASRVQVIFAREEYVHKELQTSIGAKHYPKNILPAGLIFRDRKVKQRNSVLITVGSSNRISQMKLLQELPFETLYDFHFTIVGRGTEQFTKHQNVTVFADYVNDEIFSELYAVSEISIINFGPQYIGRASKLLYDAIEYRQHIYTNFVHSSDVALDYNGITSYQDIQELVAALLRYDNEKIDNTKFINSRCSNAIVAVMKCIKL